MLCPCASLMRNINWSSLDGDPQTTPNCRESSVVHWIEPFQSCFQLRLEQHVKPAGPLRKNAAYVKPALMAVLPGRCHGYCWIFTKLSYLLFTQSIVYCTAKFPSIQILPSLSYSVFCCTSWRTRYVSPNSKDQLTSSLLGWGSYQLWEGSFYLLWSFLNYLVGKKIHKFLLLIAVITFPVLLTHF